jgi:hypothetical protein
VHCCTADRSLTSRETQATKLECKQLEGRTELAGAVSTSEKNTTYREEDLEATWEGMVTMGLPLHI